MIFFQKKIKPSGPDNDRVARMIAGQIIGWQTRVCGRINPWINRYSRTKQKVILFLFCAISSCGLVVGLIAPMGQVSLHSKGGYIPAHIGEPSERAKHPSPINKSTDSLTNKQ